MTGPCIPEPGVALLRGDPDGGFHAMCTCGWDIYTTRQWTINEVLLAVGCHLATQDISAGRQAVDNRLH